MNILRPYDIEEQIRLALSEYFTVYVRPLPKTYPLPCLLITATRELRRMPMRMNLSATPSAFWKCRRATKSAPFET